MSDQVEGRTNDLIGRASLALFGASEEAYQKMISELIDKVHEMADAYYDQQQEIGSWLNKTDTEKCKNANLDEEITALKTLLGKYQWYTTDWHGDHCIACDGLKELGHREGCPVGDAVGGA